MPINSTEEFEKAMQEFSRLTDAPADSADARRRDELDADIKAYHATRGGDAGGASGGGEQVGGGSGMPGRY